MSKKKAENLPAVTEDNLPAEMLESMVADSGAGFEGVGVEDFAIPFLQILQSNSPQCKRSDGRYIQGAQEGMLHNTVTDEIFDGEEGVLVIPCAFRRVFIEWVLRSEGGGFVAEHTPDSTVVSSTERQEVDGKTLDMLPNGNQLVDTKNHYVVMVKPDGSLERVVISMTSTQGKKSRKWMTRMNNIMVKGPKGPVNPPMFGQVWKLTTVAESKDDYTWCGFNTEFQGLVKDAETYTSAKAFHDSVVKDEVKANYDSAADNAEEEEPF